MANTWKCWSHQPDQPRPPSPCTSAHRTISEQETEDESMDEDKTCRVTIKLVHRPGAQAPNSLHPMSLACVSVCGPICMHDMLNNHLSSFSVLVHPPVPCLRICLWADMHALLDKHHVIILLFSVILIAAQMTDVWKMLCHRGQLFAQSSGTFAAEWH